jgi:hypothetical protein
MQNDETIISFRNLIEEVDGNDLFSEWLEAEAKR